MTRALVLRSRGAIAAFGVVFMAACESGVPTDTSTGLISPMAAIVPSDDAVQVQHFKVCKVGADADFTFSVNGGTATGFSLADGECSSVHQYGGWPPDQVSVTELAQSGVRLDSIVVTHILGGGPIIVTTTTLMSTSTASGQIEFEEGYVATFYNTPLFEPALGRMTGGGSQVRIDDVRITRGLTIHCDITLSNNIEINWPGGNNWHLEKPIVSALCLDDPGISPLPPAAPFDTFIGTAVGSLNGVDGSWLHFTFVDAGEPGSTDTAKMQIWAPGDDPASDAPVLEVNGLLDGGNLQAHYDQPHK